LHIESFLVFILPTINQIHKGFFDIVRDYFLWIYSQSITIAWSMA